MKEQKSIPALFVRGKDACIKRDPFNSGGSDYKYDEVLNEIYGYYSNVSDNFGLVHNYEDFRRELEESEERYNLVVFDGADVEGQPSHDNGFLETINLARKKNLPVIVIANMRKNMGIEDKIIKSEMSGVEVVPGNKFLSLSLARAYEILTGKKRKGRIVRRGR